MIVTVSEAGQKWCPMTRPVLRDDEPQKCIGPECMMWRFAEAMQDGTERGFCGLAGVVQ